MQTSPGPIWLDRGELDKIIERSAQQQETAAPHPPSQERYQPWGGSHGSHGYGSHYGYRKRKKSFLEELFD